MIGPRSHRLKVFQTQLGFFDTVVAATSQTAALRAWSVYQNLFAQGRARLATDLDAIAAATHTPGRPLRRVAGTDDPFELEPRSRPSAPELARRGRAAAASDSRSPSDRSGIEAARAALARLDRDHKAEEERFRQRQRRLEVEQAALEADRRVATEDYLRKLSAASEAFERALADHRASRGGD
jgi:hypothetical protein